MSGYQVAVVVAMLLFAAAVAAAAVVLPTLLASPAYARPPPGSIALDRSRYFAGEEITISGEVGVLKEGEPVFIKVVNPNGDIYRFDLVYPDPDGSYVYKMKVGGPLGPSGTYTVSAIHYGMAHITEFIVAGPEIGERRVRVGTYLYNIAYNITGGTVRSITADQVRGHLDIDISARVDGKLQINLSGGLISKVFPGVLTQNDWVIFVDGEEVKYRIAEQECDATLEIPFYEGSEKIEIVATQPIEGYVQGRDIGKGNSISAVIHAGGREFALDAIANADRCKFSLVQEEKRLHIDVEGPRREQGYFQIKLPHEFLGGDYTVLVNGMPTTFEEQFSSVAGRDATTIILEYNGGDDATAIDIIGTSVIPEFGSAAAIILAAASSAITVFVINRARR